MNTWDARACQEQGNWHGMTGKDELHDNVINPNHYQKIPKVAGSFRLVPPPKGVVYGEWYSGWWFQTSFIFIPNGEHTFQRRWLNHQHTYIHIYTYIYIYIYIHTYIYIYLYFHHMSYPIIFPWYLHNLMAMVNHITAFFCDTRPGLKLLQELDLGKLKQEGDVGSVW